MEQIAAIIGAVTGSLSLLGLAYIIGFCLGRMELKIDTLWEVYVIGVLTKAAKGGSRSVSQEILEKLNYLRGSKKTPGQIGFLVVKTIGPRRLREEADRVGSTPEEVLAQLINYCLKADKGHG